MTGKNQKSFYDILKHIAFSGGSSEPVTIKRTVYGTSDGKMYALSDDRLYRVRRSKNGSGV